VIAIVGAAAHLLLISFVPFCPARLAVLLFHRGSLLLPDVVAAATVW